MEQDFSIKRSGIWIRLLFTLLYIFLLNIAVTVFIWATVVQWVYSLISGEPSETLRRFGYSLGVAIMGALHYIVFVSDEKPFPFNDWPEYSSNDD